MSICLAFLFYADIAYAFEGWEHKRMGDLSYHLAVDLFCESKPDDANCKQRVEDGKHLISCENNTEGDCRKTKINELKLKSSWFFDPLFLTENIQQLHKLEFIQKYNSETQFEDVSYGDVVMCVDQFLTLEKLMAGRSDNLIDPLISDNPTTRPERAGKLFPTQRGDLYLPHRKICEDSIFNTEGARAGHVNHSHFQTELWLAQRTSHLLALMLRTSEENLFAALTANAISDHYLNDSFAPGHISTWRSRLTDIAANAHHDHINQQGLEINVNSIEIKQWRINGSSNLIKKIQNKLEKNTTVRNYFFYAADCKHDCENHHDLKESKDLKGYEQSSSSLNATIKKLEEQATFPTLLKGDDRLWDKDQTGQRFIMLLSQVRSILDVLESQPSPLNKSRESISALSITDSFKRNSWSWIEKETPDIKLDLLKYIGFGDIKPDSLIVAKNGGISYSVETSNQNSPGNKNSIEYTNMDKLFGLNFSVDNMTFGDQQNRKSLIFETLIGGHVSSGRLYRNRALLLGYQQYFTPVSNGNGLSARYIFINPQTETSISILARALRIKPVDMAPVWHPTLGARIDFGFTSFFYDFFASKFRLCCSAKRWCGTRLVHRCGDTIWCTDLQNTVCKITSHMRLKSNSLNLVS